MKPKRPMISNASMFARGWGFPAVSCDKSDPLACFMHESVNEAVKPVDVESYHNWIIAGMPDDPDSLRFYGAIPASENK